MGGQAHHRMTAATYFDGKPCRRGHVAPRLVRNADCTECVRVRHREWYAANREADLARKAQWVAENRDRVRARDAASYQKNKAKVIARSAAWYAENREAGLVARRAYHAKNRERLSAYNSARYQENRERYLAYSRNRKARKKAAPGRHTASDIAAIEKAQRGRCAYCRVALSKVQRHVDHIVPLILGGSNDRQNIQLLCSACNLSKHAADPIDYAKRTGRLL